ncbi:MAG: T9SS type A sorting domain-containing protein [Flavobacteriales bacterium]|nr:T9SS type A sorting domain-containing protein [Flavobacteriales bacterium]
MITLRPLSLLMGLVCVLSLTAQNVAINDSAVWHEEHWLYDGLITHHSVYTCNASGDTLIGGLWYTKVRQIGVDSVGSLGSPDPPVAWPLDRYLAAIRADEPARKWYTVLAGYTNEELLYDFDLTPGTVLQGTYGDCNLGLTVTTIDSVLLGSHWLKRYQLDQPGRSIIEGVGASSGLFGWLCQLYEEFGCMHAYSEPGAWLTVDGCALLGVGLHPATSGSAALHLYPNPASGRMTVEGGSTFSTIEVLDITGRTVLSTMDPRVPTIDLTTLAPGPYLVRKGVRIARVMKR